MTDRGGGRQIRQPRGRHVRANAGVLVKQPVRRIDPSTREDVGTAHERHLVVTADEAHREPSVRWLEQHDGRRWTRGSGAHVRFLHRTCAGVAEAMARAGRPEG